SNPAAIGDRVWRDTNGNGIQDPTENVHDNVTLLIYRDGGLVVGSAAASGASNGNYLIGDLRPGDYTLAPRPVGTMMFAHLHSGTNATLDNDVDPATGTATVSLAPDQHRDDVDVGILPASSIQCHVFNDVNDDGVNNYASGDRVLWSGSPFIDADG